ncbi:MAG: tRNA (N6-isopentenyl adenosine(37)-C2)-methylthiotransferase MiaB [Myxococcota bacterium]
MSRAERRPSFVVRTYGCQMNVHDSEKVSNLLHHAGFDAGCVEDEADLLLINTCSIREKAEHRLYSDLGALRAWKSQRPGRVIGVGGCVAQQEGDALLRRFPQLDFVFGTHNVRHVAAMAASARSGQRLSLTEETRSLDRFDLPERHPEYRSATPGRAFVTVMEGCDMFCSFCIVPRTRGREISRPAAAIVEEAERLAGQGVREITLLGQTVNAYGRHDVRRGRHREAGTMPFAELLGRLDAVPGLERIRYTSPHPIFFDDELVAAHRELTSLCPHVHLPLQSGSDRVLERMRRRYGADEFQEVVDALRAARPDLALTTDLIVGFPGESERDFEATLEAAERAGFADAYSFKYSPRPGTAAAEITGEAETVDPAEAQRRLEWLQARQRERTLAYHRSRVGETTSLLVEGESARSRRSPDAGRQIQGRDPQHRVVNVDAGQLAAPRVPELGTMLRVRLVEATPHSLIGEPEAAASDRKESGNTAAGVKADGRPADDSWRNALREEAGPGPDERLRVL